MWSATIETDREIAKTVTKPWLADIVRTIIQGVHKVLHTLKIFISQKPHKVETLHFRQ